MQRHCSWLHFAWCFGVMSLAAGDLKNIVQYQSYYDLRFHFERAYRPASLQLLSYYSPARQAGAHCLLQRFRWQGGVADYQCDEDHPIEKMLSERYINHIKLLERFAMYEGDVAPTVPRVIIGAPVATDLRFFVGDWFSPHRNFIAQIDRASSAMGTAALMKLLANPITDIACLQRRQALIKELETNVELHREFRRNLLAISASASSLIAMWDKHSDERTALDGVHSYLPDGNKMLSFFMPNDLLKTAGKSSVLGPLHVYHKLLSGDPEWVLTGIPKIIKSLQGISASQGGKPWTVGTIGKQIFKNIVELLFGMAGRLVRSPDDENRADSAIQLMFGLYQTYEGFAGLINTYISAKMAHVVLVNVATFTRACALLEQQIATQCMHSDALEHREALVRFVCAVKSNDLAELLNILSHDSFGSPKGFSLVQFANIVRAMYLLNEVKDEFVGALEAIGEIDAYCSLAMLVREHASRQNGFCYASFETSSLPHLNITGVWDPFIASSAAIPNSVELGTPATMHHMIISGPNKGGKSTFMRSLMVSVMLAQSCGIVPAKGCSLTPFGYFDSYVTVDDEAGRKSRFEAETERMTTLLDNLKNLPIGCRAFIIVDEMFSGTNPRDASCAGRAVATRRIVNATQSLWVISTHFPAIRELETTTGGLFKNYHVEVKRNPDGSLAGSGFTYRILPGTTEDSTAFDVLSQAGIGDDIISEAKRLRATWQQP